MPKSLSGQDALLGFFLKETGDPIFLLDGSLRIRGSSAPARELFYLPDRDRGPPFTDLIAEAQRAEFAEAAAGLGRGGATVESVLLLPSGKTMRTRLLLHDLSRGKADDIRTLVFAKPHGYSSASRFGTLVSRVLRGYEEPAIVVEVETLTIRDCNPSAASVFGWNREELLERSIAVLSETGTIDPEIIRKGRLALRASGVFQLGLCLRRRDGLLIHGQCTNVGLFDEEGDITDVLCILHDRSADEARKSAIRRISATLMASAKELDSQTALFGDTSTTPKLSDFGLSERQISVARLVASGASSKSIAYDLRISEATVKSHITAIFRKTGMKNRIEFIGLIHRRGVKFS